MLTSSSGMKRGLATVAVSALAVTGIPFLLGSASADSATGTSYAAQTTTLTAASKDGDAFDDDEFTAGDLTVDVEDSNGHPMAGQPVRYAWHVAPFEATAGYPKDLAAGQAADNGDGTYSVGFPAGEPSGTYTLSYYIDNDGTPGQGAAEPTGTDLVVKAGQATLAWEDGATAQRPAATIAGFEGSLELEDGTALTGRNVALSWTAADNAVVADQSRAACRHHPDRRHRGRRSDQDRRHVRHRDRRPGGPGRERAQRSAGRGHRVHTDRVDARRGLPQDTPRRRT